MTPLLDTYFTLLASIHEAFGYTEDWRVFPLDDQRGREWFIRDGEGSGGEVIYGIAGVPLTKQLLEVGEYYGGPIYTQRHLKKWVYRTDTHVMALVDTETDGNILLMIFDAALERKDLAQ